MSVPLFVFVVLALTSCSTAVVVNVKLTVDVLRFEGSENPINFTTRAYNGQIPGPVISCKQGDTLKITLVNRLLPDNSSGAPNTFTRSNTTNLHLHGLHVSPEGSSDDVFRQVKPNETGSYTYHIPTDHPVGTFWYHPHVHGSNSLQQGGGMAGALIVESLDPSSYLPPALAAMEEELFVLQHLCFYTEGKYRNP